MEPLVRDGARVLAQAQQHRGLPGLQRVEPEVSPEAERGEQRQDQHARTQRARYRAAHPLVGGELLLCFGHALQLPSPDRCEPPPRAIS